MQQKTNTNCDGVTDELSKEEYLKFLEESFYFVDGIISKKSSPG